MFFRNYLLLILVFFNVSVYSQWEFNNWHFGYHTAISFTPSGPVSLPETSLFQGGGLVGCSVSDSNGVFLLTNNYLNIYDRNLNVMPNGNGIIAGPGLCQTIAVNQPNNSNLYYLFTLNSESPLTCFGLHYNIIDMHLNGGLGDVISGMKNLTLPYGDSCNTQVTATRHKNNKDIWIIAVRYGNPNTYLAYLLTSSGLNSVPVISPSLISEPMAHNGIGGGLRGYLKISQDGLNLVRSDSLHELCWFNTETGVVTPRFTFNIDHPNPITSFTGKEFSDDSKFLYLTYSVNLYQLNLQSPDSASFVQSKINIGNMAGVNIQLGPDRKIYIGSYQVTDSIHVINFPSLPGASCGYVKNALSVIQHNNCFPQFVQRYKAYIHNSRTCQNSPVHFSGDIWPPADSVRWNFGDPASGSDNISTLERADHVFSSPGTYTVELYVRHVDNRTDTSWKTITVVPSPQPQLGNDRSICNGDSVVFDAGTCTGCTFEWKNLATGVVVGTNQTYTTTTASDFRVLVTNADTCEGSDTVNVSFSPPPQITTNPLSKTICNGESTSILLASTVGNTMYHWTASLTSGSVTGFSADSGLVINQILTGSGVVNYNIIPKVGNCVGDAVDFVVTVTPGDSVKVSISASANPVCGVTNVTYVTNVTNGGTNPSFQWKVNGINQGSNNAVYSYSPANGDIVSCILSSSETVCVENNPATSNAVTMVVDPLLPVSISISGEDTVCALTNVTIVTNVTNEGSSPVFQWKVNGVAAGTNTPDFTYTPSNGDVVTCTLISSENCVDSDTVTSAPHTIIVLSNVTASVLISASQNPVCSGIPVTFTALHSVPGTIAYQWFVNGNPVGGNLPNYTYTPSNNDTIHLSLLTTHPCAANNPATSNIITIAISQSPVVTYTLCTDSITTTNAKPIKLKGGIPLGGTYSGPGVNSVTGIFTPSIAGVGIKTITYSYTNAGLCSSSANCKLQIVNSSASICGNPFTDVRDGTVYKTIQLAGQCWFAENLRYGSLISQSQHQRDNCIAEKYCPTANCNLQTANFYQWDELMQYTETPGEKGLCPPAWHVPTEAEWNTLFSNWTNSGFAASALKYSGFSGFNAILSGVTHQNVQYDYSNFATFYWSSTPHGPTKAWAHGMNDPDPSVSRYPASRSNGFNVRCLRD